MKEEKIDVHTWFGLSYASWLTVPRIVLQSMPLEWQHQFVNLLNEMNNTFDWMPNNLSLSVTGKRENRFVRLPLLLNDYRRGKIEHLRRRSPAKAEERATIAQQANTAICPTCKGSGCSLNSTEQDHYTCRSCGGTGKQQ